MESSKPSSNPLLSLSTFVHQHCLRFGAELSSRLEDAKRLAGNLPFQWPLAAQMRTSTVFASSLAVPFASLSQREDLQGKQKQASDRVLSSDHVAKTMAGTSVYTVSNSNNEFILISDPSGLKSIGLLCFRQEDAEAFLAQVRSVKRGLRGGAKLVPISLDQVYMLKVEGIAFRFLPDPVQIKNALELKSLDIKSGFDGIPVFQSDLLVVKRKNKQYCPLYFRKEDIERELATVSRASRGPGVSQPIVVGSFEDVLRKIEMSAKNSGWDDLIFIPPGKSRSQHIREVGKT